MPTLEFFFDVASPYSYLASSRVEAIAGDCGATLQWRPFLLGGVFKLTGNAPPATLVPRARYLFTDLQRWAAFYGVPFAMNPSFPPNSLQAMRALTALPPEQLPAAAHALFHAYWVHGRQFDPEVIAAAAGEEALARTSDPAVKQALIAATQEAVDRGAFGAPTFFVDHDQMFFGNDRLPFVEQALRTA